MSGLQRYDVAELWADKELSVTPNPQGKWALAEEAEKHEAAAVAAARKDERNLIRKSMSGPCSGHCACASRGYAAIDGAAPPQDKVRCTCGSFSDVHLIGCPLSTDGPMWLSRRTRRGQASD